MLQMKKMAVTVAIAAASVGAAQATTYVSDFEDAATSFSAVVNNNNSEALLGGYTVSGGTTPVTTVGTFSTLAADHLYFSESLASNLQIWDLSKANSLGTVWQNGGTNAATNGGAAYNPISTYMAAVGTVPTVNQTSGNWIGGLKTSANSFSFKSAEASTFSLDSIWLYVGKTTTSSTAAELTITGYDTSGTLLGTYTQLRSPLGAQTLTQATLGAAFSNVAYVTVASKDGVLGFDNIVTTVTAVPEASTYAMMMAGLGMIGFMARRRSV